MMLYRVVMFLPILQNQLAIETGDGVCAFVTMIESSRGHCRREGLNVKRPGVERMESFVHVVIYVSLFQLQFGAALRCSVIGSDCSFHPSNNHVAIKAGDRVGIHAVLIEPAHAMNMGRRRPL